MLLQSFQHGLTYLSFMKYSQHSYVHSSNKLVKGNQKRKIFSIENVRKNVNDTFSRNKHIFHT